MSDPTSPVACVCDREVLIFGIPSTKGVRPKIGETKVFKHHGAALEYAEVFNGRFEVAKGDGSER